MHVSQNAIAEIGFKKELLQALSLIKRQQF
jgi:hypothetical protein